VSSARKEAVLITGWGHAPGALPQFEGRLAELFSVRTISPDTLLAFEPEGEEIGHEAIKRETIKCEVLIGWSLGALLALSLAPQSGAKRLILLSATPQFVATPEWPYGAPHSELRALRTAFRRNPPEALRAFAALCSTTPRELTAGSVAGLDYLERASLFAGQCPLLGSFTPCSIPTLVLHGEADRVIPWQAGAVLSGLLPGGLFSVWRGGEHDFFEGRATEVLSCIEWFVA
jgi:pimeloyl-[acyl-carrier protein] methyl ester esterase